MNNFYLITYPDGRTEERVGADIPHLVSECEAAKGAVSIQLIKRRSGRTTRMVDKYIQDLFAGGEVKVADHKEGEWNTRDIIRIIIKRLASEHFITPDVDLEKGVLKIHDELS